MLNTVILIIPFLFLIIAIEWYISYRHGDKNYTSGNFVMNLAIGAIDQVGALFYFVALYFVFVYVYEHFRIYTLSNAWYNWILAYVVIDLVSYWYHRFSHRVNFLWAAHVTHHSSEHLNLSNGFRTSLFQGVNRIFFLALLPVFGFSPLMLVITFKVSGLYDFLLHTNYVPKLGVLEKILVTPSHHRVHHGRNDIYIDKNYSSTFIMWDKLFGTFQEETVKVEYGVKGDYVDNDPVNAVTYYYKFIFRVMKQQHKFSEKLKVLFIPPDRTHLKKENENGTVSPENVPSGSLNRYAWFQSLVAVPGMMLTLLFENFMNIYAFTLLIITGVSSICVTALIINKNTGEGFYRTETTRLVLLGISCVTYIILSPKFFMLLPLYFLLISMFMIVSAKEKFQLAESIQ